MGIIQETLVVKDITRELVKNINIIWYIILTNSVKIMSPVTYQRYFDDTVYVTTDVSVMLEDTQWL